MMEHSGREVPMSKTQPVVIDSPCEHVSAVKIHAISRPAPGCEDCLRLGTQWVHLRTCLTCGHVGCCDSSPERHATKHYHHSKHPIVVSAEPGETWSWCYVDEQEIGS
jgi:uncharacterized UBP type Zn finger protein